MNNNRSVYTDFKVKRMENEDLFIFTEGKIEVMCRHGDQMHSLRLLQMFTKGTVRNSV